MTILERRCARIGIAVGVVARVIQLVERKRRECIVRLHHLFLLPAYRRSEARLGARFLAWWRDACALKIHAIGVTRPNARMQRLLRATGCVEMNRRYGFEEATELFHARA